MRGFFDTNSFPEMIIDRCIEKFLNKVYSPPETIITVPREEIYAKIYYLGKDSDQLVGIFQTSIRDLYLQIKFKFCFINDSSIWAFSSIRKTCQMNFVPNVYKYICDACQMSYIGSTVKHSKVRFFQHMGVSIEPLY